MNKIYSITGKANPRKNAFNLSYEKKLTCDMGELIPIMCEEVVPGDYIEFGNQVVIRMMPLVAPIIHEITVFTHYFFVPYRKLWPLKDSEGDLEEGSWEGFITGGEDGDNADTLPTWIPTTYDEQSLWDYMGFPINILPTGRYPIDFPKRAYNMIWNEYYRDENVMDEVDVLTSEDVLIRAWRKGYFESALPWQQRGTGPALPVSGEAAAIWDNSLFTGSAGNATIQVSGTASTPGFYINDANGVVNAEDTLNDNVVDLSVATTFDISDLRLATQIQVWMERNARAGARYKEFLEGHFGVGVPDYTIQRPVFVGGTKSPLVISEVLQTSQTDSTPQGNLAGHGISVARGYAGGFKVQEFGLVIGIMSIMPEPVYQQGINRQWLRQTKYDFYFPEFANLSEQAIEQVELYATAVEAENETVFGYQGRYDEMRTKQNMVVGLMRSDAAGTMEHWHLARDFGSAPTLSETFLKCVPDKRVFAAPSEPGFIVNYGNIIKAVRPMPEIAEPGMVGHG